MIPNKPARQKGNLQDAINAHVVNGTHFPEHEMVRLFKGACEAVRAMHTYRASGPAASNTASSSSRRQESQDRHSDDDERFPQAEGNEDGGYSYDSSVNVPLVTRHRVEEEGDVVFDGDEELSRAEASGTGEIIPYAHRDIKPGYVLSNLQYFDY